MTALTIDMARLVDRSRRTARLRDREARTNQVVRDNLRRAEVAKAVEAYWGGSVPSISRPPSVRFTLCLAGREVAEALPTRERGLLVAVLCLSGWTDQQIADHTRMTLYTTARIRARLELSPNEPGEAGT